MCHEDIYAGAYVDKSVQKCPPAEHDDYWQDDNKLRCGWCGEVVGHV